MQIYGADSDTLTDGTFDGETLKKSFSAVIPFDGAVITEILDINGEEITKAYITAGTALTAGIPLAFDKPMSSITVTGTVMLYGIRNHQYD